MHARASRETDQQDRALRPRLLMCMVIGYAAFYLTYGLSKFTAGLWHDSHGQRAFMGIGLFRWLSVYAWQSPFVLTIGK